MKKRPIVFSAWEIQALQAGRKTQFRWRIKPHVGLGESYCVRCLESIGCCQCIFEGVAHEQEQVAERSTRILTIDSCPFGQPGDRLWVRETWLKFQEIHSTIQPSGASFDEVMDGEVAYKADGFSSVEDFKHHRKLVGESSFAGIEVEGDRWKPSTQMPQRFSRFALEIVSVRVQRIQDISEDDARAEGVPCEPVFDADAGIDGHHLPKREFKWLYEASHGQDSWEANEWVWVVEFQLVEVAK